MGLEKYLNNAYAFTSTLILVLRRLIDEGDAQGMERMLERIDVHIQMFKRKQLPLSVMCRTVYRQIDKFIEEDRPKDKTSCRAGCAHCCGTFVAIARPEAKHLLNVAKANGIVIDIERLKKQSKMTDRNWHELAIEDQPCVFLDPATKQCRVYHDRPLSCRKYWVCGPPEKCNINIESNRNETQPIWFQLDAELVGTAWMTADGSDNMATLLLEAHHEST